jgi:hypothetical protein
VLLQSVCLVSITFNVMAYIMKLNARSLSALALFSLLLTSFPSEAQNRPQQPRINTNSNLTAITDWSKTPKTETEFMQGCVGQQNLQPAQLKTKQNFCQCAFTAYKNRYNPQTFFQINSLAVKFGKDGPHLVNLMMKPELDRCSTQTNYLP